MACSSRRTMQIDYFTPALAGGVCQWIRNSGAESLSHVDPVFKSRRVSSNWRFSHTSFSHQARYRMHHVPTSVSTVNSPLSLKHQLGDRGEKGEGQKQKEEEKRKKERKEREQNMSTTKDAPVTRGAFIVLEGLDRSGKSTQVGLLEKRLRVEGREVRVMRFPGRFLFLSWCS